MRALALASAFWLLAAAPAWAQAVPSKCNAAKLKATGAYAQAILGCQAKAVQKGASLDGACLEKAIAKLAKAFERAEKKGDCAGSDPATTAQNQADAFRIALGEALLPPKTCCAFTNLCGWEDDATACAKAGGTAGAGGTVCDGETGTCVAGSPASGPCCENQGECNGGIVDVGACTGAGGTYVDGGLCLASGECLPH
jgi:hypothetical protein